MAFFFSKIFWGLLCVGFGLTLIIEKIWHVNIPFGRFFLAFILIYAGVYLIIKQCAPKKVNAQSKVFTAKVNVSQDIEGKEYNVIFGSNIINLSQHKNYAEPVHINTIFGSTDVYLLASETYEISVNTVFGGTTLPNQKESVIGTNHYIIGDKTKKNKIQIEVNTVFGTTNIMVKTSEDRHQTSEDRHQTSEDRHQTSEDRHQTSEENE